MGHASFFAGAFRIVHDGLDALGPYLFKLNGLTRPGCGQAFALRCLRNGNDAVAAVFFLRQQIAQNIDAPQFGGAYMKFW